MHLAWGFSILLLSQSLVAQESCLYGDPKSRQIIKQVSSKDPIYLRYTEFKKSSIEQTLARFGVHNCENCDLSPAPPSGMLQTLKKWASEIGGFGHSSSKNPRNERNYSGLLFKPECVDAAMRIQTGNPKNGKICNSKSQVLTVQQPCYDNELAELFEYTTASAFKCYESVLRDLELPSQLINPSLMFLKFTNEGGFKNHFAGPEGVGMGQITSHVIADMTLQNRGRFILEAVSRSENEFCQGFNEIAKADLEKTPVLFSSGESGTFCPWISPSQGLQRNLLYSLGYLVNVWKNDLSSKIAEIEKIAATPEEKLALARLSSFILLRAYGPNGGKAARDLLSLLKNHAQNKKNINPIQTYEVSLRRNIDLPSEKGRQLASRAVMIPADLTRYLLNTLQKTEDLISVVPQDDLRKHIREKGISACLN